MSAGPIEMAQFCHILEQRWLAIEPQLFTKDGAKKYIGTWVRFNGKPVSLGTPIILKLESGTIARLVKVQKADRDELATFHKQPSVVGVEGPLIAVDPDSHMVTIKAVSISFEQ
jgi:hypothetical protein